MKIAFTIDQIILCGGLIVPAIYVRELRKRGYEAAIYAKQPNNGVLDFYTDAVRPYNELETFTDQDVIINVWWMLGESDEQFKGRKIQLVQGNDLEAYIGSDLKEKVLEFRQRPNWEIIAVSDYAGKWTERDYTIIENGIDDRFFIDYGLERDIDALVEGNDEINKQIDLAIEAALEDGHKKIVWMGRQTHPISGIETITSPPQEEIPKIYQRAKHFYKYSKSEGFSLPLWEAAASGCIVHTHNMGGNEGITEYNKETAKQYTWDKSVDKLLELIRG